MEITLPEVFAINAHVSGNLIRQLVHRERLVKGSLVPFSTGKVDGWLLTPADGTGEVLIVSKPRRVPDHFGLVLEGEIFEEDGGHRLAAARWWRHPDLGNSAPSIADATTLISAVRDSWVDAFRFAPENPATGALGLRSPQIGALHAVHAHWTVSDDTATIVMPTGTGKTETMLSILSSARCERILVVVPTDALRTQIANKFVSLGVLKEATCPILSTTARFPVVGVLNHIPRTVHDVAEVFGRCQVIVTTSHVAGQCAPDIQAQIAACCSNLFIDEAHHAEAPTWAAFKGQFASRRVLQFTATPFREDGRPLDGKIIFKYPLRKAQQEGYFKRIRFVPVLEFNRKKADAAIVAKAIEQLRKDADKGHILMARVDSVDRAQAVFDLYSKYPEFFPVQLHTGIKSRKARDEARNSLLSKKSRIVVCVDMLGEGFDLPELKIAAFHDIRKGVAVTLQLAGRFTRQRPDLGDATVIANTGDVHVQDALRKLYTRDPDWNQLLPELSDQMIGEQVTLQEFLAGFSPFADEIPLASVQAATSCVVYKTTCDEWNPENFKQGIAGVSYCDRVEHAINFDKNTLVVVTGKRLELPWTNVEALFNWSWELYVLIWSPEQQLLYINSSGNSGDYRSLAKAICGDDVVLIRGQEVFRAFAGVNRLRLQQVGLTEVLGRNVRYTGRMGADVEQGLSELAKKKARKSVLGGVGFENGQRITVGASRKGRIWAFRRGRVHALAAWCYSIGNKLLDEAINPDDILKGTLVAETVTERPKAVAIYADWPEAIYKDLGAQWYLVVDGEEWHLSDTDVNVVSDDGSSPLRVAFEHGQSRIELELSLFEEEEGPNYRFEVVGQNSVLIRRGEGTNEEPAVDFFYDTPPFIGFVDGSHLEGNEFVALKNLSPPFDSAKIAVWDWTGINIKSESQGDEKLASTVQARVIAELKKGGHCIVFDDDNKGEIADVVGITLVGDPTKPDRIDVDFYHCKYSTEEHPGHRVKDLYEVCGQAQKSISWFLPDRRPEIFTHLLRREKDRIDAGRPSRIEVGDNDLLMTIREMSRVREVRLRVCVVQPGLAKAGATRDLLQLLSVTEAHLFETYQIPFTVIASA